MTRERDPGKGIMSERRWHWILVVLLVAGCGFAAAQSIDDCLMCHEDSELTGERNGREISVFIDGNRYRKSTHAEMDCIDCHSDLDGFEDFPHDDSLETPQCGMCHDDIEALYKESLHGQAVAKGAKLAPQCWDCHTAHYVLPHDQPGSQVEKYNIPFMCGYCHKEGTPVTQTYDIPQDSILTHYSLSIHGEGLLRQGLTVTAVCSDCHTAHHVLPHSDERSSIHRNNVVATCMQCHGRIEQVHKKVIQGELWEKEPNKIPICVDCHQPHTIRRVFYGEVSDKECMECHSRPDIKMTRNGRDISLYVSGDTLHSSTHRAIRCAQCHVNASPHLSRPCETVPEKVDCGICHADAVELNAKSVHGRLADRGDPDAPVCEDCHGTHNIRNRRDQSSPSFPINVPNLCGKCHVAGGAAAKRRHETEANNRVDSYVMSIHGKGLLESGLVVTAMCTDCHTAHDILKADNPQSTVHDDKIATTCAKCHNGIYEKFITSVHSPEHNHTDQHLPNCSDCHQSHKITRTDSEGFKEMTLGQCGKCHQDVAETYFDTYHGKVSRLGYGAAAKCYDCHGSHGILPPDDPRSTLSHDNIVATCGKCHEGSHRRFAGYLTHATHHDRVKYPILFYTFWFMTLLLVGTLLFASVHTIMWMPRSFQAMKEHRRLRKQFHGHLEYRRFKRLHSVQHIMVIVSFLGLAVTGMILKFSYLEWAKGLSDFFGGFENTGFTHRVCAVITFAYFGIHIIDLTRTKIKEKKSWKSMIFGPDSMLPNKTDLREFIGTLKWFIGRGPRPQYGRWTYWEKFDYFAVFWGVCIIGSTGLILWFSEFFTLFLPGWMINVATIVHSDEALLATAFIFTVHFFNTHFRPDKFPMDTVIFTGRVPLEELKLDRPREYEYLVKTRQLKKHLSEPLPPVLVKTARIFGTIALVIGLTLIFLIVYAVLFGYR